MTCLLEGVNQLKKCDLMEHVGRGRTTADPERYHHYLREMVVFLS